MSRSSRKLDHIRLALEPSHRAPSDFDDIHFIHQSFPEVNRDECSLRAGSAHIPLNSPLYINAMTGGAVETLHINRNLAIAARETGVAIAVGSQRAALEDEQLIATYRVVREEYPDGVVIANLGAGCSVEDAKRAVEMLRANVLQLHVNVPQEIVMPEGDRNFTGILKSIGDVCDGVHVPVIVKEVGFGMCKETYEALHKIGVETVDVGGRGGTNFIHIEDRRRPNGSYSYLGPWGQTTVVSLLEAQPYLSRLNIFASGGIRNPLDVVKCLSLGAEAVGVAGAFLRILQEHGLHELIQTIHQWHDHVLSIMTLLGVKRVPDLSSVPVVVTGAPYEWCHTRGIDIAMLAHRHP